MAYYIDLFSPETYETFTKSNRDISGFRARQEGAASRIKAGDKLIGYMVKLSRWIGILEVTGTYYIDNSPLFYDSNDPYTVRFKVKPLVWLPKEKSIPIHEERVWNRLSFTKGIDAKGSAWTGKIRNSLNALDDEDGKFLEELITTQAKNGIIYEVDENEYAKNLKHKVRRADGEIKVSVPQDLDQGEQKVHPSEIRESAKIQALIARIGSQMGLRIWIPRNDRATVLSEWNARQGELLENLPLNYDETTIKTIEQIDVLWLRGRAIVRAFEVEHTTSIYSGILRMADLLALQPNMNIKLHIVAPYARRDKVFQEIQRPVFSLLDEAPLSERCTYLSYDSIQEIAALKHLGHLSDSVLDEYSEEVE
jgi:hypothetical protein